MAEILFTAEGVESAGLGGTGVSVGVFGRRAGIDKTILDRHIDGLLWGIK
ncbi:MAG: hypothetical protein NTW69_18520 [Chloroflexi bacterium]|nr:hypothetical protein [Chloroflexota bacterium]